jgi:arylsulfatase A-like enzyme
MERMLSSNGKEVSVFMKKFLFAGIVILVCAITVRSQVVKVLGRAAEVQAGRPNIVFMLCDDMRYDRIAALNSYDTDLQTPHLDQLVTDGMNFTRAYDTTPICSASRGQVFTGLYEFSTGCNFNRENEKKITIDDWMGGYAVRLRNAGYRTAFGGKEHCAVLNYTGGKKQDFDRWFGFCRLESDFLSIQ